MTHSLYKKNSKGACGILQRMRNIVAEAGKIVEDFFPSSSSLSSHFFSFKLLKWNCLEYILLSSISHHEGERLEKYFGSPEISLPSWKRIKVFIFNAFPVEKLYACYRLSETLQHIRNYFGFKEAWWLKKAASATEALKIETNARQQMNSNA